MTTLPSKQVCPLCGTDDRVEVIGMREGKWLFRCAREKKHLVPYSWSSSDLAPDENASEPGVMEEFGLFDDLPHCLEKGAGFVEYGMVEHRFRMLRPDTFATLVKTYGHRAIQAGRPYTTSSFLASALRILANRGELELRWGPATGFWSYDGTVSYWALTPVTRDATYSWSSYCESEGLDAMDLRLT
jgi:hypothetical protein